MFDDYDDRIEAARKLARFDPGAAAKALRALACDDGMDDETRIDAAEALARLDRAWRGGGLPADRL